LIISILAFSFAWKSATFSKPYTFEILADGVLYVYMDANVVKSNTALTPAVAMPGAIAEGLPYDVLKTNAQDSNSYISKAATISEIEGSFNIYNEGYGYEPALLPHDPETGATLFPKLNSSYRVVWKDENDHSLGWETEFHYTKYYFDATDSKYQDHAGIYILDDKGNKLNDDPSTFNQEDYLITEDAYEPIVNDEDGSITFKSFPRTISPFSECEEKIYTFDANTYDYKEVPRQDAQYAVVNFNIGFKASDDPEVDDYFDEDEFVVNKIYFITKGEDETVPESLKNGQGDRVRVYQSLSDDKKSGSFILYGTESFFVYAEIYLAEPDELIDPLIRDADKIYMTVAISVEIEQTNP